jgi:hypothetical protein
MRLAEKLDWKGLTQQDGVHTNRVQVFNPHTILLILQTAFSQTA